MLFATGFRVAAGCKKRLNVNEVFRHRFEAVKVEAKKTLKMGDQKSS